MKQDGRGIRGNFKKNERKCLRRRVESRGGSEASWTRKWKRGENFENGLEIGIRKGVSRK